MKKTRGFTLIELMVVIVILGILAAVIAPRIPGFVNKAKEGKTKGNLGNLRSALNIYYSDNDGRYPSGIDLTAALTPKYIKEIAQAEMPPNHGPSNSVIEDTAGDTMAPTTAGGWCYESTEASADWGDIIANCLNHKDSGGVKGWSTY